MKQLIKDYYYDEKNSLFKYDSEEERYGQNIID